MNLIHQSYRIIRPWILCLVFDGIQKLVCVVEIWCTSNQWLIAFTTANFSANCFLQLGRKVGTRKRLDTSIDFSRGQYFHIRQEPIRIFLWQWEARRRIADSLSQPYYSILPQSASYNSLLIFAASPASSIMSFEASVFWSKADKYLMATGVPFSSVIITKASGTRLHDAPNKRILEFTSGQMSSLLGHSHPEIVEVVRRYMGELDHFLSNMITQHVIDLAERLARFLPAPLEKSFFLNTGSEVTEAAIKMTKCCFT